AAVRLHERRGVHLRARRRADPRHVEHVRRQELSRQGPPHGREHGQDDRRQVRRGPGPDEDDRRGHRAELARRARRRESAVRYMLLIYMNERELDESAREACYRESTALADDLRETGKYIASSPLHPTSTATSVRVRQGKRLVTDGPFAETREQLGG